MKHFYVMRDIYLHNIAQPNENSKNIVTGCTLKRLKQYIKNLVQ